VVEMRALFWTYLVAIVLGLAYFIVVGAMHS
jgi:hypothetical protein